MKKIPDDDDDDDDGERHVHHGHQSYFFSGKERMVYIKKTRIQGRDGDKPNRTMTIRALGLTHLLLKQLLSLSRVQMRQGVRAGSGAGRTSSSRTDGAGGQTCHGWTTLCGLHRAGCGDNWVHGLRHDLAWGLGHPRLAGIGRVAGRHGMMTLRKARVRCHANRMRRVRLCHTHHEEVDEEGANEDERGGGREGREGREG